MRYLLLSVLAVCTATLLVAGGCTDSTAPLITPDPKPLLALDFQDPTCKDIEVNWTFTDVPQVQNLDEFWLPGLGNVTHAFLVHDEARLEIQDADERPVIGRAYLNHLRGNNYLVQLNMPIKGHRDVLHLTAEMSLRRGFTSIELDHEFFVSTSRSRGIFSAAAEAGQVVRVTGRLVTSPGGVATWTIDASLLTCGIPTRGPNDWFKVGKPGKWDGECDGTTCSFWNFPVLDRDSRANKIDEWEWRVDGAEPPISTDQRAVHTFPDLNVRKMYEVTLTLRDTAGYTNPVTQPQWVICDKGKCWQAPDKRPLAEFTYECDGLRCQFTDRSSPSAAIQEWYWQFGDGKESTLQNPEHWFTAEGTYRVSLTVWDADGLWNTTSRDVIATHPDEEEPDPTGPTAAFTFECEGLTCNFTDTSTKGAAVISSWHWDFGDGNTNTTDQDPTHIYDAGGTYTVTLTVTDDEGALDQTSQSVTVIGDITLTAELRTAGPNRFAELTWSGATTSSVDIWRNDVFHTTTSNSGSYSERLPRPATYTYKVCEAGNQTACSNEATVTWPY